MKKLVISLFLLIASATFCLAQVPQAFNYQAVYQDAALGIYKKSTVAVVVSILQSTPDGSEVFTETHSTSTNENGLFTLMIGSVNEEDFAVIDWANGPFFLNVNVNGTDFGTTQLITVPFAMYAEKSGDAFSGNYKDLKDVPSTFSPLDHTHSESDIVDLNYYSDNDIDGNEDAFANWDKDSSDDFDGDYISLKNAPESISVFNNDVGYLINESDGDSENELQNIYIENDSIRLSRGGAVPFASSGLNFIPKVLYQIGGMGSPYTIDISEVIGVKCTALIGTIEYLNKWTVSYYGGQYFEMYYGNMTEEEKIRIENHIENTNNSNYYEQSGQTKIQITIPVINGDSIVLNHLGIKTLEIHGYYK